MQQHCRVLMLQHPSQAAGVLQVERAAPNVSLLQFPAVIGGQARNIGREDVESPPAGPMQQRSAAHPKHAAAPFTAKVAAVTAATLLQPWPWTAAGGPSRGGRARLAEDVGQHPAQLRSWHP